jgi:uncharacterized protein with FMN-binding domain
MKRVVLIAGGTVGGLGAVLSVTPPQLSDNGLSTLSGASASTSIAPTQSAEAVATKKPVVTKKSTTTATKKSVAPTQKSSAATVTPAPSKAAATSAPAPSKAAATSVYGQFTGDAIDVGYGIVQVKITVSNGKITEADVVQAPSGRNQRWTDFAVPNLRSQTLSAQSAAINGVSGASYTSYGWYKSLITALQKAGMSTGV